MSLFHAHYVVSKPFESIRFVFNFFAWDGDQCAVKSLSLPITLRVVRGGAKVLSLDQAEDFLHCDALLVSICSRKPELLKMETNGSAMRHASTDGQGTASFHIVQVSTNVRINCFSFL